MPKQTRILTPPEIAMYAYRAGFRGKALLYAVAVAIKESGGNPRAYNPESAAGTKPGSGSRGLWQIYGGAHPWANTDAVYDPQENANAAYKVFKEAGSRFTPWSVWNNGSAQQLAASLKLPNLEGVNIQSPGIQSAIQTSQVASLGGTQSRLSETTSGSVGVSEETKGLLESFLGDIMIIRNKISSKTVEDYAALGAGMVLVILGIIFLFVALGGVEKTKEGAALLAKLA